ncbi:MAG: multiple sugar transport system permease protein, partial [Mycobacterium sp.]|nr:multiple sugar transport system permease protein [Mycobacterium sp.]
MTTQTPKAPATSPDRPAKTPSRVLPEVPIWRRKMRPYLLSIPALVIVIGILYPFVVGAYYAFLNYAAVNPDPHF